MERSSSELSEVEVTGRKKPKIVQIAKTKWMSGENSKFENVLWSFTPTICKIRCLSVFPDHQNKCETHS